MKFTKLGSLYRVEIGRYMAISPNLKRAIAQALYIKTLDAQEAASKAADELTKETV